MDINKQLGMRIKYLRTIKKWSQEDLALEAGINKNYLSDLERGSRNPTVKVVEKIAKAFGITISELLSEQMNKTITKSNINHLFRRIHEIYERLDNGHQ